MVEVAILFVAAVQGQDGDKLTASPCPQDVRFLSCGCRLSQFGVQFWQE